MAPATKFVTQQELRPLKAELERLSMRTEVLTKDVHGLATRVGDVEQELEALTLAVEIGFAKVDARFVELEARLEARFQAIDARFERLEGMFATLTQQVADGNSALLSAILQLAR
jgi:hypothetical protein